MANPYFQFKDFRIEQDRCAMKVSTDACIFGAWMSERIPVSSQILDIGTGTGLLALMLAQKNRVRIDAIELDLEAYEQARKNVAASAWKDYIQVLEGDARYFNFPHEYDLIISNPPFFENDLQAATGAKNRAKHSTDLRLQDLVEIIHDHLQPSGSFAVLLPFSRMEKMEALAQKKGFHLKEKLLLRQSVKQHSLFRIILYFSRQPAETHVSTLTIHDENGAYTSAFVDLLKDYYLYL